MTDAENLGRQVGTKGKNMDAKLILPHSKVIEIFLFVCKDSKFLVG